MQRKTDEIERSKDQQLDNLRREFEHQIGAITAETEQKKDILKQHSEWIVEKTYLENQNNFLKNQLEEAKKLRDALLLALQRKHSSRHRPSVRPAGNRTKWVQSTLRIIIAL